MRCRFLDDPAGCLVYREEHGFPKHDNHLVDIYTFTECVNCKVGIFRAREVASVRPPMCVKCDKVVARSARGRPGARAKGEVLCLSCGKVERRKIRVA